MVPYILRSDLRQRYGTPHRMKTGVKVFLTCLLEGKGQAESNVLMSTDEKTEKERQDMLKFLGKAIYCCSYYLLTEMWSGC